MTQFQNELLKIVLDKGLLALIVLGFAFYLNRLIEKFRAKNNYEQKILEFRIQAYKDILFSIHQYESVIHKCLEAFNEMQEKILKGTEIDKENLEPRLVGIVDKYDEMQLVLQKNALFLSSTLMEGLTKFIDHRTELKRALITQNPLEVRNAIKALEDVTRSEGLLEVQATMLDEIFNFKI